jgi:hypothetical protein
MRISLAIAITHDLQTITAAVSQPTPTEAPIAAGPGVILALVLIVALLLAAIIRALAVLSGLLGQMLALLGTLAIGLAAIVILAGMVLSNRAGPSQPAPAPTARPTSTNVRTTHVSGARSSSNSWQKLAPRSARTTTG